MQSKQMQDACIQLKQKMLKAFSTARKIEIGVTDPEVARYAAFVEFGWVQRVTPKQNYFFFKKGISKPPKPGSSLVNPARPFFRETIATHSSMWQKIFVNYLKAYGYDSLPDALTLVGNTAKSDFQETIAYGHVVGGASFEERADLTIEMYSLDAVGHESDGTGSLSTRQPLNKSGDLLDSIAWRFK